MRIPEVLFILSVGLAPVEQTNAVVEAFMVYVTSKN